MKAPGLMEAFPVPPFWIAIVQALIAGITINALAGFGDELGWRGLMLNELRLDKGVGGIKF